MKIARKIFLRVAVVMLLLLAAAVIGFVAAIASGNILETAIIGITAIVALLAAFFVLLPFVRGITKAVCTLNNMLKLGAQGDITISAEEAAQFDEYSARTDELGEVYANFLKMVLYLTEIVDGITKVSAGDLNLHITPRSEIDVVGPTLQKVSINLDTLLRDIRTSSEQAFSEAQVVSERAKSLATNSVEHNLTLQSLSSAVHDITEHVRNDKESTTRAVAVASHIMECAEAGSVHMDEMISAVKEIEKAGEDISKIIKVINEIAFQTNILALNAAVEAARAGQHGKGFAVVADEVRNLAAKSAEAAEETNKLVNNSIEKSVTGARIAAKTADNLKEIVEGINENGQIIGEISDSINEQLVVLENVDNDLSEVKNALNATSSSAAHGAATAESLKHHSTALREIMMRFNLRKPHQDA